MSIEAAMASGSRGYSRKTKRTLPVSMNRVFSSGNVPVANWAQCEQVIEAYSMIVTAAAGEPSARSGNGPGSIRSGHKTPSACAGTARYPQPPQGSRASGAALFKNFRRVTLMPDPLHCPSVFAPSRIEIRSDPSGAVDPPKVLHSPRCTIAILKVYHCHFKPSVFIYTFYYTQ